MNQKEMEQICPVCNGLTSLEVSCSDCGHNSMGDLGVTSDYFGPYSPFEEISPPGIKGLAQFCGSHECLHLLQCPGCTMYKYRLVDKVNL